MKLRLAVTVIGIVSGTALFAQSTIRAGSEVKVKGTMSLRGSLGNDSERTDLSEAHVILIGTNQTLRSGTPLSLQRFTVEGGGNKTLQGDWTITRDLALTQGVVVPSSGKLLYTGTNTLAGSTDSYVNGTLFQRGSGTRFFPIGAGSVYAPMSLGNVQDAGAEIGVQVFTSGASLTLPLDVTAVASNRHWEITASSGSIRGSGVALYVPGSSVDAAQRLTVVEADNASGGTAINLGGGLTDDFVVSFQPATQPVLTIGIAEKLDIRINDLITPYNLDELNDRLKIVNIEYTVENTVTLLDRWGVVVRRWSNFRNYDDPRNPNTDNFDFSNLSPGNYICVVEYKLTTDSPKVNMTQMISVLKGN